MELQELRDLGWRIGSDSAGGGRGLAFRAELTAVPGGPTADRGQQRIPHPSSFFECSCVGRTFSLNVYYFYTVKESDFYFF